MIERAWEKKIEPLTVRVSTAVRITGLSRSRIYELIQSGDLETIKVGRATLVQYRSLKLLTGNVVPGVGETDDLRQSPAGTPST
jgi:excisionase family DNA binding protein